MMDAKSSLVNSLKNTKNLDKTIEFLEQILQTKDPFALYIATMDRSDCSWIFDKKTIYSMLGGKDRYDRIYSEIQQSSLKEEDFPEVLFFIFRKVGPLYSIGLGLEFLSDVLDQLYNEL